MTRHNQAIHNFMLRSIKQLYGEKLGALDGEIGQVKDFYFDDDKWGVRYVVADTGSWLTGRQVLLSPPICSAALLRPEKCCAVHLTRQQIQDSPSISLHLPVSRQYEEEYHEYYGWPYYWQGDALWGMSGVSMAELPARREPDRITFGGRPEPPTSECPSAQYASSRRLQPPGR